MPACSTITKPSFRLRSKLAAGFAALCLLGTNAQADSEFKNPLDDLRAAGVDLRFSITGFTQGLIDGDARKIWRNSGKADVYLNVNFGALGLAQGLFLTAHLEQLIGNDINSIGEGAFLPFNTAIAFPRLGGYENDLSLLLTYAFSQNVSLTVGKFNMLDAAARTPLLGGGGLDTFMNIGLAAPISGVTPPYIIGASLSVNTEPANFSLLIYDPRNAQDPDVLRNPFADGVTTSVSVTVPTMFFGLPGFYGARGVYSTQEGLDLASIPQLPLPPGTPATLGTKKGYIYGSLSFQQYLFVDPDDPKVGWGIFGQVALSDGNPNIIESSYLIGIGGNSFIPGRKTDRWGIAHFRYNYSRDLINGLAGIGTFLRDEWGVEAFYNAEIMPGLHTTVDLQYVRPTTVGKKDAIVGALRTQIKF